MGISKNCINLVKEFEGLYLNAYQDVVGVWTIGYGITSADKSITGKTIKSGMKITKETAEKWLEESLNKKYLPLVMKYDKKYNWNQNEIDALVSFAYNIGSIDALTANGTRSKSVIANKILLYNKAGGKVYNGLTRRRNAERALFVKACANQTTPAKVVKKAYSSAIPSLPPRGYYKLGDGSETLQKYKNQIKRVQKMVNWICCTKIEEDGIYGKSTESCVKKAQKILKVETDGRFGKATLNAAKKYKR